MGKRANPAVIGAFVVGAVVLTVVAVAVFGSGRLFRKTYDYVIFFTGDVNGLKVGAPVKLKGVELGSVKDILLNVSELGQLGKVEQVRIPVIIELDAEDFTARGAKLTPDPETVKRAIDAGLRARLTMESFVTGLLYIQFDLYPGSPLNLVADKTVKYVEIPSLPTPLEEIQMKAAQVLAKFENADIEGLLDNLASTVRGINMLVNSPHLHETVETLPKLARNIDGAVDDLKATLGSVQNLARGVDTKIDPLGKTFESAAHDAGQALREATVTLQRVNGVLESDSPVMYQIGRSLADLASAARAIRRLAEDLERNPSSLVRGRAESAEPLPPAEEKR